MLGMAFVLNWPGLIVASAVFAILAHRHTAVRAVPYSAFLLIGAAVARLQWVLVVETDPDTIGWEQFATIVLVMFLTAVALIASYRRLRLEKPLIILFLLTLILAVFQFGGVPIAFLNGFARLYAGICIVIPLFVAGSALFRRPNYYWR